ncbi:MAG: hypothetical protein QM744_08230 [Mesorhizobium sp.]
MAFAQRRQVAFALVAAIVFVLQTLGSAWADRAVPLLDAFGNPLCVSNEVPGGGQHQGDHGKLTDCCTIACNSLTALALGPQGASEVVSHFRTISEPLAGEGNIRPGLSCS